MMEHCQRTEKKKGVSNYNSVLSKYVLRNEGKVFLRHAKAEIIYHQHLNNVRIVKVKEEVKIWISAKA